MDIFTKIFSFEPHTAAGNSAKAFLTSNSTKSASGRCKMIRGTFLLERNKLIEASRSKIDLPYYCKRSLT